MASEQGVQVEQGLGRGCGCGDGDGTYGGDDNTKSNIFSIIKFP